MTQFIQRHRDILNITTDPGFLNITVHEIISYLEDNPLKYCALVVDAEKVETAQRDHQHEVDFRGFCKLPKKMSVRCLLNKVESLIKSSHLDHLLAGVKDDYWLSLIYVYIYILFY